MFRHSHMFDWSLTWVMTGHTREPNKSIQFLPHRVSEERLRLTVVKRLLREKLKPHDYCKPVPKQMSENQLMCLASVSKQPLRVPTQLCHTFVSAKQLCFAAVFTSATLFIAKTTLKS